MWGGIGLRYLPHWARAGLNVLFALELSLGFLFLAGEGLWLGGWVDNYIHSENINTSYRNFFFFKIACGPYF